MILSLLDVTQRLLPGGPSGAASGPGGGREAVFLLVGRIGELEKPSDFEKREMVRTGLKEAMAEFLAVKEIEAETLN